MILKFQVTTPCFSCRPPDLILSNYISKSYNSLFQWLKIRRPPSQATISNHPNVLIFVIPLAEWRAGEAWEPNKIMLLPRIELSFTSPLTFHFHLLFCYSLDVSHFWPTAPQISELGRTVALCINIACGHKPRHLNPWRWRQSPDHWHGWSPGKTSLYTVNMKA
jgi:hypothetical protein